MGVLEQIMTLPRSARSTAAMSTRGMVIFR